MVSSDLLRRFPFFADLTEEELKSIAMISDEEKHKTNTFICRERGKAEKLYVLLEGTVEVMIDTDEEGLQHETVSTLKHGDAFCWALQYMRPLPSDPHLGRIQHGRLYWPRIALCRL